MIRQTDMLSYQADLTTVAMFVAKFVQERRVAMGTDKQRNLSFDNQNGDKRLGIERRRFSYHVHIPERRSGEDRRSAGVRQEITSESYNEIALALG